MLRNVSYGTKCGLASHFMETFNYEQCNELIAVSHETYEKFCAFHKLLLKWQKRINLISSRAINEIWVRHIVDSAQLINYINDRHCAILDIGSGAGFPGLILSILGINNITLVESDNKKSIFLKEAIRLLNLSAQVINDRVENLKEKKYDIVTSRAVADLNKLIALSYPHLSESGYCLFPKGKNYIMELDEAKNLWDVSCETHPSITDSQGIILKIFSISKKTGVP